MSSLLKEKKAKLSTTMLNPEGSSKNTFDEPYGATLSSLKSAYTDENGEPLLGEPLMGNSLLGESPLLRKQNEQLRAKQEAEAQKNQTPLMQIAKASASPLAKKFESAKQDFTEDAQASGVQNRMQGNGRGQNVQNGQASQNGQAVSAVSQEQTRQQAKQHNFSAEKRVMQDTLAEHASNKAYWENTLKSYEAKNALANVPAYSTKSSIAVYKKQLVETRTLIYYQQHLRMLSDKEKKDPEAKRRFVVKRVARELWTNFCVRGDETPMLLHLHERLRKEYNEDLQFYYKPGSIELIIMRPVPSENSASGEDKETKSSDMGMNEANSNFAFMNKAKEKALIPSQTLELNSAESGMPSGDSMASPVNAMASAEASEISDDTSRKTGLEHTAIAISGANAQGFGYVSDDLDLQITDAEYRQAQAESLAKSKNGTVKEPSFNLQNYVAIDRVEQVGIVNKAWHIAQDIINTYAVD